jgi:hypothetical protein
MGRQAFFTLTRIEALSSQSLRPSPKLWERVTVFELKGGLIWGEGRLVVFSNDVPLM